MYLLWTVKRKSHILWLAHILLPVAWFCVPEFIKQELFGKPIKHARWQASLVVRQKHWQFESSTTSWNGSEKRTLPARSRNGDAVTAATSPCWSVHCHWHSDTVLHERHSPCHKCTWNRGLATTSCHVDIQPVWSRSQFSTGFFLTRVQICHLWWSKLFFSYLYFCLLVFVHLFMVRVRC